MNDPRLPAAGAWSEAVQACALFAVDPSGLGGVCLRAAPGPVRDRWLAQLRDALPKQSPVRRVPLHVTDARLLGGLDLAATLGAGRRVAERGILAEADGGVVLLAMAERLEPSAAAKLASVLDAGEVALERDGLTLRHSTQLGVVALDEGAADDERPPAVLTERLAFAIDLACVGHRDADGACPSPGAIAAARQRLPNVGASDAVVDALCAASLALGIGSVRAPLLALRAARAAAALAGRSEVAEEDAALAARLVLAWRATQMPAEEPAPEDADPEEPSHEPPSADEPSADDDARDADPPPDESPSDLVLEAAKAAIPAGLLERLRLGGVQARAVGAGKAGARRRSSLRGAPRGVRRGDPRSGARLNVVETLRAAAPWQRLRRAEWRARGRAWPRVEVRRDDFRVTRFSERSETTAIFAVDASGSTALQRLAEAKGAVELLLAECYVRRDRVALVVFRGRTPELLLPPTRSLVRARRGLAGLPGGGGTPLASGIEAATELAEAERRRGSTPLLVLLTDGRANVARDGTAGREPAERDALEAARRVRAAGLGALLVDTSPRPRPAARQLADDMDAHYLLLPHADAAALGDAVLAARTQPAHGAVARR